MRWVMLSVMAVTCLLAGCSKKDTSKQVTVYMYSEYIDPEMLKEFEQQTGIKPRVDEYDNSEQMLAKLQQAGGVSQYDVIVVSDVTVPALVKEGLVQPIDRSRVPHAGNVDEKFRKPPFDPEGKYTLPYQWGTVGLMYNKGKAKSDDVSWAWIFDPARQPGAFVLMDSMRDMLGIALRYQGHSMNSRDPQEIKGAGDLILQAKKSNLSLGFEGGVGGKNRVVTGEAIAAMVYNGDALKAVAENPNAKLAFRLPKEGGIIWVDVMMIPAKSPNLDAAHKFINYILDAKAGAQLSNFNRYATPNAAAMPFIRDEDRTNAEMYPSDEMMKKLEYLEDVGKDTRLYDEVWTTVKAR